MTTLTHRLAGNTRFTFTHDLSAADLFDVVSMAGTEELSRLFRFELVLVSDKTDVDLDAMIDGAVHLTILAADGKTAAPYHGRLSEFDQLHQAGGYVFYCAVMVPRIWQLSLFRTSAVHWVGGPITDLLRKIFLEQGLSSTDIEFSLKSKGSSEEVVANRYVIPVREFVYQYQESHLDFISRWLEKEGMYYWVEHGEHAETMVISDDGDFRFGASQDVSFKPVDTRDSNPLNNAVQVFTAKRRVLPGLLFMQDYDPQNAKVTFEKMVVVSASGIGAVTLHDEGLRSEAEMDRSIELRAEEIRCGGQVFQGESTVVGIRSGHRMRLSGHYRQSFNDSYLVTGVIHHGSQARLLLQDLPSPYSTGREKAEIAYANDFTAIPATVQFRAGRVTARPRIAGTITANVELENKRAQGSDGPVMRLDLDKERAKDDPPPGTRLPPAYAPDENGRYRVRMHFDAARSMPGKASSPMRMATPHAGDKHGMYFPLMTGDEVLVSFTDGDPDRPVIVGAVPNSENKSLVDKNKPQQNLLRTPDNNSVEFSDVADAQVIWMRSPYKTSFFGVGKTDDKGGGGVLSSTSGSATSITVGSSNSLTVGAKNSFSTTFETSLSLGLKYKVEAGTSINFTAGADVSYKMGQSFTIDDADSVSMKTSSTTKATDEVLIQAGQRKSKAAQIAALKKRVRDVVIANLVINGVLAAGAATAVGVSADRGRSSKNDGKLKVKDVAGWGTTVAQVGTNAVAMGVSQGVLRHTAKAIERLDEDNDYASSMTVARHGINMEVDAVSDETQLVPASDTGTSRLGIAGKGKIGVADDPEGEGLNQLFHEEDQTYLGDFLFEADVLDGTSLKVGKTAAEILHAGNGQAQRSLIKVDEDIALSSNGRITLAQGGKDREDVILTMSKKSLLAEVTEKTWLLLEPGCVQLGTDKTWLTVRPDGMEAIVNGEKAFEVSDAGLKLNHPKGIINIGESLVLSKGGNVRIA